MCAGCGNTFAPGQLAYNKAGDVSGEVYCLLCRVGFPGGGAVKDTNPKDAVGTKKWRQYSTVPTSAVWAMGVAMLEGARKYGRHNYRVAGVRASVYVDAAKGHIDQFWEGENIDADSGLHHVVKAMASLAVLYDSIVQENWVDDRPPKQNLDKLRNELQEKVNAIFQKYPDAKPPFTELGQKDA